MSAIHWRCPACGSTYTAAVPSNGYGHRCPESKPTKWRHVEYKPVDEIGKYKHPEAYGMPAAMGVDYREQDEIRAGQAAQMTPAVRSLQSRDETAQDR